MKDKLGIIGGVGSKASAYFYDMILDNTKVNKDQDHINMIILNHATIPDRTSYILDNTKENPLKALKEDVKLLNKLGCKMIAIPCNTSCYFHESLQKKSKIPVNNMVEDTINYLKNKGVKSVYILATTGTVSSSLYQNACLKFGLDYRIPTKDNQELVMSTIYDDIKCGKKVDINKWNKIIEGASEEAIILGCTELSILKKELKLESNYIDPLEIQTDIILKYFNKEHI
ncbi:MAG: amino acid racemase [Bacilli bacterium]